MLTLAGACWLFAKAVITLCLLHNCLYAAACERLWLLRMRAMVALTPVLRRHKLF